MEQSDDQGEGGYIDTVKNRVIARAYDKFFNIGEVPETKPDRLKFRLAFPVTAYVKENGFLGIVSYIENDVSLFVTTKSNLEGEYAGYLKDLLRKNMSSDDLERMKQYVKENGVSFVFDCIDMKNDPHIIEYPESRLYLLDIIYNDLNYHKFDYEQLCEAAEKFGLRHKEKAFVIDCWHDFALWLREIMAENYLYNGRHIEGFVIEDRNGYMVKLKLWYYSFWKSMRKVAKDLMGIGGVGGNIPANPPTAREFYEWLKPLVGRGSELTKDICSLRRMFYQAKDGK